ncbi:CapA family protein [Microbulbifer aggregans]|uniref:CapA family protein n=1 Tax=Microbulbifer aggregans TaxID=1769779 RepID=UPI001CFCE047|nr:CapA family protein [Microbulbifer aggregans]
MSLSELLSRARPLVEQELANLSPPYTLFLSACDGAERARVTHVTAADFPRLWLRLAIQARKTLAATHLRARWLRIDWVTGADPMTWQQLRQRFRNTKRGYFRYGLALDAEHKVAFLEQELNANAMLYGGNKIPHVVLNESRFRAYTERRFGKKATLDFSDNSPVSILSTRGLYLDRQTPPQFLYGPGRDAGRRIVDDLDEPLVYQLIGASSGYLSTQVSASGRFEYGWHCCFDRAIGTYNNLRHASSTYAMTEAWEVTGDDGLHTAIERALKYLTEKLIKTVRLPSGEDAAFLVESNGEIKLGGNAVCLLALVKYSEITGNKQFDPLLEKLALGIRHMQDPDSGKFVHVLQYPQLSVKDAFRIIYYDGEAAFGLMRLYGLTRDPRWLAMVESAFDYFIANEHWRANDHWLSYCVNELTLYRPEARYYEFGIQNVSGHLDFIIERITTFPTLLELMMAAERMVSRLREDAQFSPLLQQLDLHKFYRALHTRAMYLLNGFYWPEYAMYFKNPGKILGSFFIRHHAFRVRIDDVEHYLSGFVAFRKYLLQGGCPAEFSPEKQTASHAVTLEDQLPTLAWGGDVNLARRQHYRTEELGEEEVLGRIPALNSADLSVINLECVVATSGEQGIEKGEESPFYYRARPEMLKLLCRAGVDVVTTANNHSGDYGAQALLEQGFWLDGLGLGHTGSGVNVDAAFKPVVRAAGDLNVAIFSIDATQKHFAAKDRLPGNAYLSLNSPDAWTMALEQRISDSRKQAHVVVVAVHWGNNLQQRPGKAEMEVGHRIINAGADAVLGTSAHRLQGIEVYRERPIIHDAGNLLFDSPSNTLQESGIFRLSLSQRGVEQVHFCPVGVGFGYCRQFTGSAAREVSVRFSNLCSDMGTSLQLMNDGSAILGLQPPEREHKHLAAACTTRYKTSRLENLQRPMHPNWFVNEVPASAQITPLQRGPLTLLGIQVSPQHIDRRQTLWVETFWAIDAPVDENLRLDIRAVPVQETSGSCWGESMDHDPCDWQMPTSRWQPGIIYRDFYGLRSPALKRLKNGELRLEIGLIGGSTPVPPEPVLNTRIAVQIPGLGDADDTDTPATVVNNSTL